MKTIEYKEVLLYSGYLANQYICVFNNCLAKVPGCDQYYKNIGRSLFQNGRQRVEIAISLIFVMFIE